MPRKNVSGQSYKVKIRIFGSSLVCSESKENAESRLKIIAKSLPNMDMNINPFKPNGMSNYYQLDQSISVLRVGGWYITFLFEFR